MVSFSNMDGAHCDSVVDHYTLPSNSIQMDVKVPVQPSNFDPLQKGALMGASTFMEQDKNHSNQCNYKTKSIPSRAPNRVHQWPAGKRRSPNPSITGSVQSRPLMRPSLKHDTTPRRHARCSRWLPMVGATPLPWNSCAPPSRRKASPEFLSHYEPSLPFACLRQNDGLSDKF